MKSIDKETLKAAIKKVWIRAQTEIQPDVLEALEKAKENETDERAKTSLGFPYQGDIREAFNEAIRELTEGEFPMRSMVVNPITREDKADNTGMRVPLLHFELEPDLDYFEIKAAPKGAGSGMWGTMQIFAPSVGLEGVKKFVVDSVLRAGCNPCPPMIVGVGIGGTMEEVSRLATEASNRPVNVRNPEKLFEDLEEELKEALNLSQIGAMGMGGDTTVLAVNVEYAASHNPWLPVAVNVNCWCGRRATCRLYSDGHVEQL